MSTLTLARPSRAEVDAAREAALEVTDGTGWRLAPGGRAFSSPPTFHLSWPGDDVLALEALDFAEAIGTDPEWWQSDVLTDWMLTDSETGRWTHRSAGLIVPRQAGKTWAISVRLLYALFYGESDQVNIMYSAHRFQSATAQFREMVNLIDGNADLRKRVKRITSSTGNELIETIRGGSLFVQSRMNTMTSQTRGRQFDLGVLDEALVLRHMYMAAFLPTLSSRPNPQIIYASSSGDADSEVLASVRDAAYKGARGMTLSEWAADPTDDPASEATVIKTNPGYPARPKPEAVEQERNELPAAAFARERLGIWSVGNPDPALVWEVWDQARTDSAGFPGPGVVPVVAADVSIAPDGERTGAVAVAWWDVSGVILAVLVRQDDGTDWVQGKVSEVANRYGAGSVRMCPGAAKDVADEIAGAWVEVERVPFAGLKGASQRIVELLGRGEVRVQRSEVLDTAARRVPRRQSSDNGWVFDNRGYPPAGLNALALAVTGVLSGGGGEAEIWV